MTVGELREALKDANDNAPVFRYVPAEDYDHWDSEEPITGVSIDPGRVVLF
jgi:hypothetical protein